MPATTVADLFVISFEYVLCDAVLINNTHGRITMNKFNLEIAIVIAKFAMRFQPNGQPQFTRPCVDTKLLYRTEILSHRFAVDVCLQTGDESIKQSHTCVMKSRFCGVINREVDAREGSVPCKCGENPSVQAAAPFQEVNLTQCFANRPILEMTTLE